MPRLRTDEGKPRYGGIEGPERGALERYHSTSITERLPLTDLNRKAVNRKESTTGKNQLQDPTGKSVHCISSNKSTISTTQPMTNRHHLELLLFSNGTDIQNNLHKIVFLSFACWTFLWFCCSFYVPNGSFQLPNKPIFCWQNDCCFIFKVNN